ncbi:MAG: energy-coupling factor transporter transmembrane protein EcfT [Muribaculaceae bacterium]|nr:energy-coupling factor transporter transmembrane protein EcfT [Muribaculaceae bacterium]
MTKLEKVYLKLSDPACDSDIDSAFDVRSNIIVSFLFLGLMLSVPLGRLSAIIWFALYPIIASTIQGISFGKIFRNSLFITPLLVLIGIFNPILDKNVCFTIYGINISYGWISFCSIIIRGLLSVQALLILIDVSGFINLCRGLHRLGVPAFLTDQLLFIHRYLSVLVYEALTMQRARSARGYGKKRYPVRVWGVMIGQLFIRAIDRAEKINRAMIARGFSGTLPPEYRKSVKMRPADYIFIIVSAAILIVLRFYNLSDIFISH